MPEPIKKVIHTAQRSVISAVETRVSLEACRSTVHNAADQQQREALSQAKRKARTCALTTERCGTLVPTQMHI